MANGKALERSTLRDQAESRLRELILDRELEAGDRINEVLLANELGISRGPLREALQVLAREGLVQIVQHRGAFVRAVSTEELRDLYGLRIALETYAARAAAQPENASARELLAQLLKRTRRSLDQGGGYPPDLDFHQILVTAAHNKAIGSMAHDVHVKISLARARSAGQPDRAREAYDEHESIVTALRAGDGEEAARLLEEHLWRSFDSALQVLALTDRS